MFGNSLANLRGYSSHPLVGREDHARFDANLEAAPIGG